MGGVDVIVFTGGVGENDATTRYLATRDMEFMGVDFDQTKNAGLRGKEAILTSDSSRVTVMVVPTNEELVIALDTYEIVTSME